MPSSDPPNVQTNTRQPMLVGLMACPPTAPSVTTHPQGSSAESLSGRAAVLRVHVARRSDHGPTRAEVEGATNPRSARAPRPNYSPKSLGQPVSELALIATGPAMRRSP